MTSAQWYRQTAVLVIHEESEDNVKSRIRDFICEGKPILLNGFFVGEKVVHCLSLVLEADTACDL